MFRQGSATCWGSTLVAALTLTVASVAVGGEPWSRAAGEGHRTQIMARQSTATF